MEQVVFSAYAARMARTDETFATFAVDNSIGNDVTANATRPLINAVGLRTSSVMTLGSLAVSSTRLHRRFSQ
jgi:hypothetical protein